MDMELDEFTDDRLIFLVGAPRSGTTYLQRLLATHPPIKTAQESHLFDNHIGFQLFQWDRLSTPYSTGKRMGVGMPCYHTKEEFLRLIKEYAVKLLFPFLKELNGNEVFLEKTPLHSKFINDIIRLFPGSKIIHIIRHPFDSSRSYLHSTKTWFTNKRKDINIGTQAGSEWKNSVATIINNKDKIKNNNYLEVKYEDFINEKAEGLSRIFQFIGFNVDKSDINKYLEANEKDNLLKNQGGKIPIKGEIAKKTGVSFLEEPEGFINKKKFRLNPVTKFLVWRKVYQLGKGLGYDCNYLHFLNNTYK